MNLTNNKKLPEPFVKMATSDYQYTEDRYSVTSLLSPVRQILLTRRHADEITEDVSDRIWALFGTAVHKVLEEYGEGNAEQHIEVPVGNNIVSGVIDYVDGDTVVDYKTCSVWKFKLGDFEDWKKQLAMYGYLLTRQGKEVSKGKIVAILRDHRKGEARKGDYPDQVEVVDFDLSDYTAIETFMYNKLEELNACKNLPDDELPACTPEERWARDEAWAVMKDGRKTAVRVFDNEEEATAYMSEQGDKFYIEHRPPFNSKCEEYCPVKDWCNFYKSLHEEV